MWLCAGLTQLTKHQLTQHNPHICRHILYIYSVAEACGWSAFLQNATVRSATLQTSVSTAGGEAEGGREVFLVRGASAHCWGKDMRQKCIRHLHTSAPSQRENEGGGLATGDLAWLILGGFCLTRREAAITIKHCCCYTPRRMCQKML